MQLYIDNRLILEWDEENTRIIQNHLLPFELRDRLINTHDDHGVYKQRNQQDNLMSINYFLSNRMLDIDRDNADKLLKAYGYDTELSTEQRAQITLDCHCVSIVDNYWTKQDKEQVRWTDINIRENSLNKVIQQITLQGKDLTIQGKIHTPEFSNQGCFAKAWIREPDGLYLCKGTKSHGRYNEIHQEILASEVLDCINIEHVQYEYHEFENTPTCRCRNIASNDYSLITAEAVQSWCRHNDMDFIKFVTEIDPNGYYKMLVADYLIDNPDRHLKNWGFFQDNQTGHLIRLHPLFDHNYAFDKSSTGDTMSKIDHHKTLEEMAEHAIHHCSIQWQKSVSKKIFPDRHMYDAFMQRCCHLELCHQKKIWQIPIPSYEQKNRVGDYIHKNKKYETIITEEKKKQIQSIRKHISQEADFDEYLKRAHIIARSLSVSNFHNISKDDIER